MMPVDVNPAASSIRAALDELEAQAIANGSAIGIATALPVSIETIAQWAAELEAKGVALVPISALMTGGV
jgi:polysaccharide deacetylase 2 family uncharacterized protein YibQ